MHHTWQTQPTQPGTPSTMLAAQFAGPPAMPSGSQAPITRPIQDGKLSERSFTGFGPRTLLETAGVPIWDFIGAVRRREEGWAGLSPLARAVAAGLSLEEGERRLFWERYSRDNPLGDARILDLGALIDPGTFQPPHLRSGPDLALINFPPGRPGSRYLTTWQQIGSLPANCADLVICNTTLLHPLTHNTNIEAAPSGISAFDSPAPDRPGILRTSLALGGLNTLDTPGALKTLDLDADKENAPTPQKDVPDRQRLLDLLTDLGRLTSDGGICVLTCRHSTFDSWLALGEALATSVWRCWSTVPWIACQHADTSEYQVEWQALIVLRRRLSPTGSRRILELVVERATLMRANDKLRSYASILKCSGNVKLNYTELLNLWRAMVMSEAVTGDAGPDRPRLADALQMIPALWLAELAK